MPEVKPVTLEQLRRKGLDVWVWCNDCEHNRVLPLTPLLARFGPGQPVVELAAWARCTRCGSRRAETRPAHGGHGVVANHRWRA